MHHTKCSRVEPTLNRRNHANSAGSPCGGWTFGGGKLPGKIGLSVKKESTPILGKIWGEVSGILQRFSVKFIWILCGYIANKTVWISQETQRDFNIKRKMTGELDVEISSGIP